jgi:hypothetical protein
MGLYPSGGITPFPAAARCISPCSHFWPAQGQPLRSYGYLVLCNPLFIAPLALILAVASSRKTLARLARWQQRYRERVRFAIGATVITLGLGLLAII